MFLQATLLVLVVNLASVQLWHYSPLGKCNYKYKLTIGQVTLVNNPHWPGLYRAGDSCRWTFDCPYGYFCNLRCFYIAIPYTPGCNRDKLLVSITGDPEFKDAELFCGRTYIKLRSSGTRILMGLITSEHSTGGSFKCAVRSEPEMHIDTFINSLGIKSDYKTLKRLRSHRLPLVDLYNASAQVFLPHSDATSKRHFRTGQQVHASTMSTKSTEPTKSVVDAIIHAIGLTVSKRKPNNRAVATTQKVTPPLKPAVEMLIKSLGLHRRYNRHEKPHVHQTGTTPAKTTRASHKGPNATAYIYKIVTNVIPTRSIFEALVEAIV